MYYILFYSYGTDAAELRAPHRPQHLLLLESYRERGEVVMAGAFSNPMDGAAIVFEVPEVTAIHAFIAADPYVANGVVTDWVIREWNVVVPSPES